MILWVRCSGRALWGQLPLLLRRVGGAAGWLEDHNGLTHMSDLSARWPRLSLGPPPCGLSLSLHMASHPPGPSLQLDSIFSSTWIPRRQKPRFTMARPGPFPEGLLSLFWGAAWHQEFLSLQVLLWKVAKAENPSSAPPTPRAVYRPVAKAPLGLLESQNPRPLPANRMLWCLWTIAVIK